MQLDHPWADSSRAPLYVIEMRQCSEDALHAYFLAAEDLYARVPSDQRIALTMDTTRMSALTARHRQICSEHVLRIDAFARRSLAGVSLVIQSPLLRGALTAITWVSPFPFPFEVFSERDRAMHWAESQLD